MFYELDITSEKDIAHAELAVGVRAPCKCEAKHVDEESMPEATRCLYHFALERSMNKADLQIDELCFKWLVHWVYAVAEFTIQMVAHDCRLRIGCSDQKTFAASNGIEGSEARSELGDISRLIAFHFSLAARVPAESKKLPIFYSALSHKLTGKEIEELAWMSNS